ncbi:uncharacterized protein PGTG_14975 [Puccinia graminis f. sp. tritici CRL 75-36-700-3]|uniref:Uncharacterized protein n=1 Tax=Puccinia graminis f. sp. tritici (strain CRL 75-36-700-3 / race SCCL) TaxID=418459 RepID=E3KXS2_PUCGT|nr:uncharacterized protein PGTG_14975 [Puccinia graminis f. sp. tritici CRL 75-36-700-3]EFP89134.2 hypothetical protein PGTG_14975 [Puccinia graminis f. sp. tritici CRL 75-36-700-3]
METIDRSSLANATEQGNYTRTNRSSLLDRLSSPIASASSTKSLPSELIG